MRSVDVGDAVFRASLAGVESNDSIEILARHRGIGASCQSSNDTSMPFLLQLMLLLLLLLLLRIAYASGI